MPEKRKGSGGSIPEADDGLIKDETQRTGRASCFPILTYIY